MHQPYETEAERIARLAADASEMLSAEAITLEGDTITIEALPLTTPDNVVDFAAARARLRK